MNAGPPRATPRSKPAAPPCMACLLQPPRRSSTSRARCRRHPVLTPGRTRTNAPIVVSSTNASPRSNTDSSRGMDEGSVGRPRERANRAALLQHERRRLVARRDAYASQLAGSATRGSSRCRPRPNRHRCLRAARDDRARAGTRLAAEPQAAELIGLRLRRALSRAGGPAQRRECRLCGPGVADRVLAATRMRREGTASGRTTAGRRARVSHFVGGTGLHDRSRTADGWPRTRECDACERGR